MRTLRLWWALHGPSRVEWGTVGLLTWFAASLISTPIGYSLWGKTYLQALVMTTLSLFALAVVAEVVLRLLGRRR